MLSLPLITPRDSHELWFGSPQQHRAQPQHNQSASDTNQHQPRRNAHNALNTRAIIASATPANSLSALQLEERALRARKQNIASFGYSWIKPAGCPKTMLGMKEEEAEREEALAAAAAEMANVATAGDPETIDDFGSPHGADGQDDSAMGRDLDDDVPDADAEGLVEEGEEALEEEDVDEEGYMERDLDDDIPEAFDAGQEGQDDFDNQPDLDDEAPVAGDNMSDGMAYDLDEEVPEAAEVSFGQEEEWQHTDTEAELDDDDDEDPLHDALGGDFWPTTSSGRGPSLPPIRREIETEAQRRFLQRWSGGGDALDANSLTVDHDDLHASIASHSSRRSGFGRFSRRASRLRDSFS